MKTRLVCFICALLLVFMFGCQTGKSGWEFNAETLDEITEMISNLHFYHSMQIWEEDSGTFYGENMLTSDKIKVEFASDYFWSSKEYDENMDYSKILKSDAVKALDDSLGITFSEEFLDNGSEYFEVSGWSGDAWPCAFVESVKTEGDQVVVEGVICWTGNWGLYSHNGFTAIFKADKIQLISLVVSMNAEENEEAYNEEFFEG